MKNFSLIMLLGVSSLGLAGCSENNSSTGGTNTNARMNSGANSNQAVVVNSNAGNTTNSNMSLGDSTSRVPVPSAFMSEAAMGGMAEVELSTLAKSKAQNAEVKKFAQQMVEDHSNANTELKQLAGKKNVTLPTEPDAAHKGKKDKLSSLSGADFDKEYVDTMVADHEKTVALFKAQADSAADADVKAFAAKTLPKLQGHLDMIKGIQSKLK